MKTSNKYSRFFSFLSTSDAFPKIGFKFWPMQDAIYIGIIGFSRLLLFSFPQPDQNLVSYFVFVQHLSGPATPHQVGVTSSFSISS